MQPPSIGRVVTYTLNDGDLHLNNGAREAAAIIVRVWEDNVVNLKVQLDGESTLWRTSVWMGDSPGQWHWPTFVPARIA
jgi:hypothetical protein